MVTTDDQGIIILSIETAEKNCSIAISKNDSILFYSQISIDYSHDKSLHTLIKQGINHAHTDIQDLDAVAVSMGPGSYTGIRIGVSAAKGLSYSLDIPLIAVSTLKAMAYNVSNMYANSKQYLFFPMIDARRNEIYTALYNNDLKTLIKPQAVILDANVFESSMNLQPNNHITYFGSGAKKSVDYVSSYFEKHNYHDNIFCDANAVAKLAYEKYKNKEFEDIAYFEPAYLKPFFTTMKK